MANASLRWMVARIALGAALGLLALALLAGTAWLRDRDALWILADVVLVGGAAAALAGGLLWLREAHARSATVRAWATLGATLLLVVGIIVALD